MPLLLLVPDHARGRVVLMSEDDPTREYVNEPKPVLAVRDWYRTARVRIIEPYSSGAVDPWKTYTFVRGEELQMIQWGCEGRLIDRAWWTSADIDAAFIVPESHVEVLQVLEEVHPTADETPATPEEQPERADATGPLSEESAIAKAREVWPEAEGFERAPEGWTFRVGAGYAWILDSGRVAQYPEGMRSLARRWMRASA